MIVCCAPYPFRKLSIFHRRTISHLLQQSSPLAEVCTTTALRNWKPSEYERLVNILTSFYSNPPLNLHIPSDHVWIRVGQELGLPAQECYQAWLHLIKDESLRQKLRVADSLSLLSRTDITRRRHAWTLDETEKLIECVHRASSLTKRISWHTVSSFMSHRRSRVAYSSRWKEYRDRARILGCDIQTTRPTKDELRIMDTLFCKPESGHAEWTPTETQRLIELVQSFRKKPNQWSFRTSVWLRIWEKMKSDNKSLLQMRYHWEERCRLSLQQQHPNSRTEIQNEVLAEGPNVARKSFFTRQEDFYLMSQLSEAVLQHQASKRFTLDFSIPRGFFVRIEKESQGRFALGKSNRRWCDRFHRYLDPRATLKHPKWTEQEQMYLYDLLQQQQGVVDWKKVALSLNTTVQNSTGYKNAILCRQKMMARWWLAQPKDRLCLTQQIFHCM